MRSGAHLRSFLLVPWNPCSNHLLPRPDVQGPGSPGTSLRRYSSTARDRRYDRGPSVAAAILFSARRLLGGGNDRQGLEQLVFMQREMPSVLERLEQRPDGRLTGRGSSKAFQGAMAMAEMPGSTGKRSTMVSDAVSRTAMLPNDSVMKARASSGVSATRPPSSPSGTRVTACVGVS